MTPLMAVEGLSFGYEPGRPVLRDVSLDVVEGVRLAVLGPNGGGKTTLFHLLAGALAPQSGRIRLDGAPVRRTRRGLLALRSQVQLVVQDPDDQLFAADVHADVSFGPTNQGLPVGQVRERVAAALDAMGIAELADRPTHLLSAGQRKRVTIAGAIAMRPRLLLLDEPAAGLDPAGLEALLAALGALHDGGTTLVVSTHDVDLAYRWADRLALVTGTGVSTADPAEALRDGSRLAAAGLGPAWAPLVHRMLDRCGELAGARPRTAAELDALLAATGRSPQPALGASRPAAGGASLPAHDEEPEQAERAARQAGRYPATSDTADGEHRRRGEPADRADQHDGGGFGQRPW